MTEPESQELDIDLRHYLQVLSRRRWIILCVFLVTVLSSALYVATARPVYTATSLVLIEKEQRSQTYHEETMVEATADDYYQTQYKLLKSRSLLARVYEKLSLAKSGDFAGGINAHDGAVAINPVRRSRLVNVSVESHDPRLAAQIANTLSETYVSQNLESKLFISKDILRAIFPNGGEGRPGGAGAEVDLESLPAVVNSPLIQNFKANYANLETRLGDRKSVV
jgi:polysaccharide biosynthesis transport protein